MKNKLKIILPAALIVLALVCTLGWWAMVRQDDPGQVTTDPLGVQQSLSAEETPDNDTAKVVPEEIYTLPPVPSAAPKATADLEMAPSGAGDTVTVEEDGTIVIAPDFEGQAGQAVKIVKPNSQAETNMGGGGGHLELGSDGAFHGTPPTSAPVIPTPTPTAAPVVTTPTPVESSTPEVTPAPEPVQEPQGGPPSQPGTYDGQISPDGQYYWIGGFGWNKKGVSNGGIGGQIDDSDKGWAPGEMGDTVGTM